jgi:hypothetical protein
MRHTLDFSILSIGFVSLPPFSIVIVCLDIPNQESHGHHNDENS